MSDAPFLPYGRHCVDEDDVAAVAAVLRGDWLTTGPAVAAFENALAAAVGAPHALACANGTAALHLAAMALGLGPGDAVVVPAVTFLATANAARYVGAEVVFADVDPDSGLMESGHLEQALARAGRRVRAVFPVHLNGQCADTAAITALARRHGLAVVEDACHALATTYTDGNTVHRVGACEHADLATFSFHPVKTIAMGEGGAVTTRDETLAARVRRLRSHGMVREGADFLCPEQAFDDGVANPWYYEMPEPGYNYRASDLNCALGVSQLAKLDAFAARRRALAARYDTLLAGLAPLVRPIARTPGCDAVWHLYVAAIDFDAAGTTRGRVMRELGRHGIGTQVHYLPVNRQPYYRRRYGEQVLPGADEYYRRALSLPLFPAMDDADVDRVVDALATVLEIT